jgi:hypothetical protein
VKIDRTKQDYYCPQCHENSVGKAPIVGLIVGDITTGWKCSNCSWSGGDGELVKANESPFENPWYKKYTNG